MSICWPAAARAARVLESFLSATATGAPASGVLAGRTCALAIRRNRTRERVAPSSNRNARPPGRSARSPLRGNVQVRHRVLVSTCSQLHGSERIFWHHDRFQTAWPRGTARGVDVAAGDAPLSGLVGLPQLHEFLGGAGRAHQRGLFLEGEHHRDWRRHRFTPDHDQRHVGCRGRHLSKRPARGFSGSSRCRYKVARRGSKSKILRT